MSRGDATSLNTDDSFLCHIYRQSVGNREVANVCTSTPFPRRGKYQQVTNVYQIHQLKENGLKRVVGTQLHLCYKGNGDYTNQCHIHRQSVGKVQMANICTSAPFPRRGIHAQDNFFFKYNSRGNADLDICTVLSVSTAAYQTWDCANRWHTNPTSHPSRPLITLYHFSQCCLSMQELHWLRSLRAESKYHYLFHLTLRSTKNCSFEVTSHTNKWVMRHCFENPFKILLIIISWHILRSVRERSNANFVRDA
jgi:hypothetical protein